MAEGEIILYRNPDGLAEVQLHAMDGTVWLSQAEIAELFHVTPQNVTLHVRAIYGSGELEEKRTCKEHLQVRPEGARTVQRAVRVYSLEMILAIGYRVRSPRGVQFRQWATTALREYLVKGFVLNDGRLKEPGGWDYFDELLARIRDIRASEQRFYQKVRALFALSVDYRDDERAAQDFFAEVQNKMLHAVTRRTAAELIVERANPTKPNMNLTTWRGDRVRKQDVIVAKNYLAQDEITSLNRFVTMFLDYAEDRVEQRRQLSLADWRANVDRFLTFNERPILPGKGRVSHETMVTIAHDRYEAFDAHRRTAEAAAADADDMRLLEALARKDDPTKPRKGKKDQ